MLSTAKVNLKQEKYEKNLKERLKKLFSNDLFENSECNFEKDYTVLNESSKPSLNLATKNYSSKKKEMKSDINLKLPNGQKTTDIMLEAAKPNMQNSPSKINNNNFSKFKEKLVYTNPKNRDKLVTARKLDNKTDPNLVKFGPIATGYVPNITKEIKKKRKTKSDKIIETKKQKFSFTEEKSKQSDKKDVTKKNLIKEKKIKKNIEKIPNDDAKHYIKNKDFRNNLLQNSAIVKGFIKNKNPKKKEPTVESDVHMSKKGNISKTENPILTSMKKIKLDKINSCTKAASQIIINKKKLNIPAKGSSNNENKEEKFNQMLSITSNFLFSEDEYDSDPDYNTENSSYFDSEYEDSYSEEVSSFTDEMTEYETDSNDEDYKLPEDVEEDLYIPQGIAVKYDIDEDMSVGFDSDSNEPQIIELPCDLLGVNYLEESEYSEKINIENNADSDSSCPTLVPINRESHNENEEVYFENAEDSMSETESVEASDCCSEYSEATEGSLCFMETQQNPIEDALKMEPQIFNVSDIDIKEKGFQPASEYYSDKEDLSLVENILMNTEYDNTVVPNSSKFISSITNVVSSNQCESTEYFESKFFNGLNSRYVLVLLKEKLHFYGTLRVKLIAGCVEIFGYKPRINECVELYSPRGYSFLNISPCKNTLNVDLTKIMEQFNNLFLVSEITNIVNNYDSKMDAVLLIEKNYSLKRIELLGKYMKENLFPSMNSMQVDRPYYDSEFVLRSIIYNKTDNELRIDPKWQTINLEMDTKLMIIGGKSVGKSTCLRYIINKEIKKSKRILLIDLDIGQSEIFVPQTVSATILDRPLLGPGYFLNLKPNKAFVYGDINVVLAPERYLENIKELSKYCRETKEFENIPWIINTMGYNKGFGSELIAILCHYFRPTEILQLQGQNFVNNFDYLMEKEILEKIPLNVFKYENLMIETSKGNLSYLENLSFGITMLNSIKITNTFKNENRKQGLELYSKDSRYAMLIIRLGAILEEKFDWLTDVKPACCNIDDIKYKSFGDDILSEEEFLDIINSNLVYMCNLKDDKNCLECFGIGIVRGIDKINRKIYLISSVPKEIWKDVNCLSVCNIPLPSSIFLNQGPKIKGNVPYSYNTNEFIATRPIKNFSRLK